MSTLGGKKTTPTLKIRDIEFAEPTVHQVRDACRELREACDVDRNVTIERDGGETWLVIYFVPRLGFFVSGCVARKDDYVTLVEGPDDAAVVDVYLAGDTAPYARRAFVSTSAAEWAAIHFLNSGQCAPELTWCAADEVMRR